MKKIFISIIIIFLLSEIAFSNYRYEGLTHKLKVFYNLNDKLGINASIKGKIVSISTSEEMNKNNMVGGIQPKTKVTVRIFKNQNIEINDKLLVINEKNLVVSRFTVKYMFKQNIRKDDYWIW